MPTLTVQSGPRNARTDPESGLRYYSWEGRELPSVTSIRRMAGVPFGLHNWAIGKVVSRALDSSEDIEARLATVRGTADLPAVRALLAHELRTASTDERDAAARLGTAVHDAAAEGRLPEDVPAPLRPRLRQFRHWLAVSGAEVVASEFQCWNLTVGYAGTADALVRLRDGRIWLVDYKTGKGVYGEYALQLIAYLMAEFVGSDNVVDEETTALLREAVGMAVLHLENGRWEFRAVRADAETWNAFRGLLAFAVWMRDHGPADSITTAVREGKADDETPAAATGTAA